MINTREVCSACGTPFKEKVTLLYVGNICNLPPIEILCEQCSEKAYGFENKALMRKIKGR